MKKKEMMASLRAALVAFGAYEIGSEDIERVAELSARAFSNSALHHWFMEKEYDMDSAALMTSCSLKPLLGNSLLFSDSPELHSVIALIPPGFKGTPVFGFLKAGGWKIPAKCGPKSLFRMMAYEDAATELRRRTDPTDSCVYIYNLAVDPVYQKTGLTHRLLDPVMTWSGINDVPLYLETNDACNFDYYRHMGFTQRGNNRISNGPVYNYAFSVNLPLKEDEEEV